MEHIFQPRATAAEPTPFLTGVNTALTTLGITGASIRWSGPASIYGVEAIAIDKPDRWTETEITTVQAAIEAAPTQTPQKTAQREIDELPLFLRALVLTLIDQINVLRAGLPSPLPPVTPAQALSAIRNKAGTL